MTATEPLVPGDGDTRSDQDRPPAGGGRPPLVEVTDLRTTFRSLRGEVVAVDGVSMSIGVGERVGIVGESGSGKTVFVRSLMHLFDTDPNTTVEGEVHFDGRDIGTMSRKEMRHFWGREVAMVFQDPMTSLNPVKRIGAQIIDPMRYHLGLSRKDAREQAAELLGRLRLSDPVQRLDQYPHELSGGMRQRVAIAVGLSCSPKLLIADEPTTALDVTVQKQILNLLDRLSSESEMSVILITHDLGVAAGRTDRVAVMYAGEVVELATPGELFRNLEHPYTQALLRSSPRIDDPSHTRLQAIGGRPPDLANPPRGCRFAARCPQAQFRCVHDRPLLRHIEGSEPGHVVACHFPVGTPEGDDALAQNLRHGQLEIREDGIDLNEAPASLAVPESVPVATPKSARARGVER